MRYKTKYEQQIDEDIAFYTAVRDVFSHAVRADRDSPVAQLLNAQAGKMAGKIASLAEKKRRRLALPVYFAMHPGYIHLGQGDDIRIEPEPRPRLDGLRIAYDVFWFGLNAPAILNTQDYGKTPNACDIALHRAGEWAERRCPALALQIASIKVSKDGTLTYRPNNPDQVVLVG